MSQTETLEVLKKRRTILRSAVTKALSKIENSIDLEDVSAEELEEYVESVTDKFKSLKITDNNLELLINPDDLEKELEAAEKYAENVISWKSRANRKIREIKAGLLNFKSKQEVNYENASDVAFNNRGENSVRVKLPKLSIPIFDGNMNDWLTFWNCFESSVHNNNSLNKIDKFNYLRAQLRSTALSTIEGFPISEKNYDAAVELLKNRYGNKQMLIHTHMSNILATKPLRNSADIYLFRKYFDKLSVELRSLESLGTNIEEISSVLCTTILKTIPQDLLIELNKSENEKGYYEIKELIKFLSSCLHAREKAMLVSNAIKEDSRKTHAFPDKGIHDSRAKHKIYPTVNDLIATNTEEDLSLSNCVFCNSSKHCSSKCQFAAGLTIEERKSILMKKGACFKCLQMKRHLSRFCKQKIVCYNCKGNHNVLFCYKAKTNEKTKEKTELSDTTLFSNENLSSTIYLQTLCIYIRNNGFEYIVRAILDTASSKSYISKFVANKMELEGIRKVKITHGLFGGTETTVDHNCYSIDLRGLRGGKNIKIEVMEQDKICATVPKIRNLNCISELKEKNIFLSDICPESKNCLYERDINEIHVLLGADIVGNLFTGKIENLSCGLVAMQTSLGWTTMGKINDNERDSSLLVLSLLVNDAKITDLWNLDSLGIVDPAEKQSKEEVQKLVMKHFKETVTRENDGRYKVSLPWINEHPPIPSNKDLAEKRLQNNIKNLNSCGLLKDYEKVLDEWEEEGIIEKVNCDEKFNPFKIHYLPHRAVIKPTSTTKIRPVFDGSAHVRGSVSINDCIEKGPNLIELIPSVLSRFRIGKIGVVADIRKAFLQISLNEKDRDYLRFLWWRDGNSENLEIYRHCRVVFGISCSPFLLAATLTHHLDQAPENLKDVALKLKESFYVDNCVASVESREELEYFRNEARKLLASAQFDLRGWCYNQCEEFGLGNNDKGYLNDENDIKIPLLGLMWDTEKDTLSCDFRNFKVENELITKRTILSLTHKIFDPIGFTCPVTLIPKLLLQKCWKMKASWDSKLPDEIVKEFKKWSNQIKDLENLEIPRKLSDFSVKMGKLSLHAFCDASKSSYATCVFLRNEQSNFVTCQLVQARSRVAPLKDISIPRLELLACCIGARLTNSIKADLKLENIDTFYWSDSMDALYWIKREGPWATFVENRVREIRKLTSTASWNFVPGHMNPADLPSRGCCAKSLIRSQWWLGPTWLLDSEEKWPKSNILPNMEIVNTEKRKTIVTASNLESNDPQFYNRYSSYSKILRITGWILRFIQNSKRGSNDRIFGQLTNSEIQKAETVILKLVQKESFENMNDKRYKCLRTFTDSEDIIRVKTKIFHREDEFNFRLPVVLPSKHHVVQQLIFSKHLEFGHCGVSFLMTVLREKYWILKSRKTIKSVISKCFVCKKHASKPPEVEESVLPVNRVREAAIFEIIGVDLCGPLYLKDESKVWILLITCAIFRAVHFELLYNISTDSFILGLTRFIARRGRPSVIYADNGTNFTGCRNLFSKIDFEKLKTVSVFSHIDWQFIPPSAPWWGGFWERLVGILKRMLRRVVGKTSLNYEELSTVLCDCEGIINSRPLTYVSDDNEDLRPITPSMFLQEITEIGIPELDCIDPKKLNKRYIYRCKIKNDLRARFRNEYLGSLKCSVFSSKKTTSLCVDDVVLIWTDNSNRINWPLGRILELYPSKDDIVRVAKVKTASGVLIRPVKKLCPLEVRGEGESRDAPALQTCLSTRRGRTVRPPDRLQVGVGSS